MYVSEMLQLVVKIGTCLRTVLGHARHRTNHFKVTAHPQLPNGMHDKCPKHFSGIAHHVICCMMGLRFPFSVSPLLMELHAFRAIYAATFVLCQDQYQLSILHSGDLFRARLVYL